MPDAFLSCLRENVAKLKGFGEKRVKEAGDAYERIRDSRMALGEDYLTAGYEAMAYVTDGINTEILRKQSAVKHNLTIMADAERRLEYAVKNVKSTGGMSNKVAMAMRSFNENVQSIADAPSVVAEEARLGGLYHGVLARAGDTTTRRRFGRKPPKEEQRDLVRELVEGPGSSGNTAAKGEAKAFREVMTMAYERMRSYGVRVRPYGPDDQLPVNIQAAKLLGRNADLAKSFGRDMDGWLDWSKMQWPDGRRVLPAEREMYVRAAQNGITSGGKKTGFAKELGDDVEKAFLRDVVDERLFRFKDGASWQAAQDKYGDGDVFGTLQSVLQHVIREEAKARIYGPDPDRMVATIAALAQAKVVDKHVAGGNKAADKAMEDLNSRLSQYHKEATVALRSNPMTNSTGAIVVGAMANTISAAQLGSAFVANTMGDATNMVTKTMAENRSWHALIRTMVDYVKGQMPGQAHPTLRHSHTMGYMHDDFVYNDIQTTRYNLMTTVAPTATKAWARFWTMAGGVPRHTSQLRAAVHRGFLIDMAAHRSKPLADLPEATQRMMADAGIDAGKWETIRERMAVLEPRKGVEEYDTIQSYQTLPRDLAERMHRMQTNEVNGMVLMPTNEASVIMRGTTRPDTAVGAILSSFSMYTAQPLAASYHTIRSIMNAGASPTRMTAAAATFGITMVMTGALGIQMRAVIQRRELDDMSDPAFWGRAAVAGGAFNIWGSYITGIAEGDADNVYKQIAGPLAGAAIETSIGVVETGSQLIGLSDKTDGLRHLAEAVERYMGPKPFYAAAVLSREVYERMKELADPVGYKRSVSTRINNAKKRGQTYTPGWKPSDRPITEALGL